MNVLIRLVSFVIGWYACFWITCGPNDVSYQVFNRVLKAGVYCILYLIKYLRRTVNNSYIFSVKRNKISNSRVCCSLSINKVIKNNLFKNNDHNRQLNIKV